MTRHLVCAALLSLCAVTYVPAGPTIHISPDVPTTPDGVTFPPWSVVERAVGGSYALEVSFPGQPAIGGLHKLDQPGSWLFSVKAPSDLAGGLSAAAEPRDVVRADAGTYSLFFDGSCASPPVPASSGLNVLYLDGGDGGDLITGFDIPTTLGATTFHPNQLIRYERTGGVPCDWSLVGLEVSFTFGTYYPTTANVTGADRVAGQWILSLDIPTDVGPPGAVTRTPGQIVSTDGTTWGLFDDLRLSGNPGWPISSQVDALSCEANPGRINSPFQQITMDRNLPDITITCPGSCSSGGASYSVYEGTIGSVQSGIYDHVKMSCTEACPGSISFIPSSGGRYYLVVAQNGKEEGSHGIDSDGQERPQASAVSDRCVEVQTLTECP